MIPPTHPVARTKPLQIALLSLFLFLGTGAWNRLPAQQAAPASLFPNGDFAQASASGDWPEGWGTRTPGNGVTWETDGGRRFMRLVSQRPGELQTLYRSVNLTPGKVRAIKVSVRYRASGVKPGARPDDDARALVAFQDATGRPLDTHLTPLLLAPSAGWTDVSGQTLVPGDASRCILVAGLVHAAAGTVDVAEIDAVPLPDAEAATLAAAAPKPEAPPASWVSNDDFSRPDADGKWPADWGKPAPGMSWETEGGTHFVRVVQQEPGKALMLSKTVPLQPGVKGIELLIRWRAEGVEHGEHEWFDARTIVHFLTADGQTLNAPGGDVVFTHKPAATGWKEGVSSYMVPEGATALQLMPGLFKVRAGTLDLAIIRVTPMKDATTELESITRAAYGVWKGDEDQAHDRRTGEEIDAQLAKTGNLVPNGGFEDVDAAGNPVAWGKQQAEGITWQEEKGDHFMRLVSQDPKKARMLYRMIPLKLGIKGIEVTVRYRTDGIVKGDQPPGDARIVMHYLTGLRWGHLENGKEVTPQPADIELSGAAKDWTEVTRRFPVPEGATKLQFMPGLWNVASGTLDITDIRVAPIGDADATAMSSAAADVASKEADRDAIITREMANPPLSKQLTVSGNTLLDPDGKPVWLQGLCIDSMEWGVGENMLWSTHVALDAWKANAVRLPVSADFWFGRGKYQKPGSEEAYRQTVDKIVRLIAAKGGYVALDLHVFGAPTEAHRAFWKDAAVRYKDNPAVLYELFNEPHGISWEIWRDGGSLSGPTNKNTDVNANENTQVVGSDVSVGMQGLVDAVRATGAKNVIIAGGLDWGYDLSRVAEDMALNDRSGNGIMYSAHIYPWKKDWQAKVLAAAAKYPIFIGEDGTPPDYSTFQFIPEYQRYPIEGWANDLLGFMQKNHLNWTGFSFHPHCGPMIISDWDYTPTPYWGVYVKEALAGQQFEMKAMR